MLGGHDAQHVQQVADVEADLQRTAVVIDADFFFRFFLFRVVRLNLQLTACELQANTAVFLVGENSGAAERFAQCLAMIPGTSRSGSTIIGGLLFGLSRKAATEFSFFLAMPTMIAASVYSGYKYRDLFQPDDFAVFATGFITSFIFAMIAVRGLLKFIATHSYAVFAWYRIAFGLLILATWLFGWIDWTSVQA